MEPKDTHDKFEEFLKRTLDQYEEEPANRIWTHVAKTIPDHTPIPKPMSFAKWHIGYAASIIFLLGALALQYLESQSGLGVYEKAQIADRTQIDELTQSLKSFEERIQIFENAIQQPVAHELLPINPDQPEASNRSSKQPEETTIALNNSASGSQLKQLNINNENDKKTTLNTTDAESKEHYGFDPQVPKENLVTGGLGSAPANTNGQMNTPANDLTGVYVPNAQKVGSKGAISVIPMIKTAPVLTSNPNVQLMQHPIVQIAKPKAKGYTVWAAGGIGNVNQEIDLHKDKRGFPDNHAAPDYQTKGKMRQFSLLIEKPVSRKWSFTTGLNLAQFYQSAQQEINLRPRNFGQGGPNPHMHDTLDYSYSLQTTVGLVDVDIRASAENVSPVQLNDSVNLEITVKEKATKILIPLEAKYQFFNLKRLSCYASAGLGLGFTLEKSLDIENVKINSQYNIKPTQQKEHRADPRKEGRTQTDLFAQFGLGVAFAVTPRAQVFVSPQFQMKLNQTEAFGWANHSIQTLQVQAGVGYNF